MNRIGQSLKSELVKAARRVDRQPLFLRVIPQSNED